MRTEAPTETSGTAPPRPFARHVRRFRVSDAATVLVAAVLLTVTTLLADRGVPEAERAVFAAVNGLPDALEPPVVAVMWLGTFPAVVIAAGAALLWRRFGMASAIALSGTFAYFGTKLLKVWIERGRPADALPQADAIVRAGEQQGFGFPSGHAAVSAAIVGAALPYVPARWRWWLLALPAAVAFGRMYVGAHLPLDVVGGLAIGFAAAALFRIAFGRPETEGPVHEAEVAGEELGGPGPEAAAKDPEPTA
jgi:undecaprenyl-diphosphatase